MTGAAGVVGLEVSLFGFSLGGWMPHCAMRRVPPNSPVGASRVAWLVLQLLVADLLSWSRLPKTTERIDPRLCSWTLSRALLREGDGEFERRLVQPERQCSSEVVGSSLAYGVRGSYKYMCAASIVSYVLALVKTPTCASAERNGVAFWVHMMVGEV